MQAVNSVNEPFLTPQQILSPEADIVLACHKLHNEAKTSTNLEWLRAYQDNDKCKEDILPPVWMNIDMDSSRKNKRTSNIVWVLISG